MIAKPFPYLYKGTLVTIIRRVTGKPRFGENLRWLRKRAGLRSYGALADKVGEIGETVGHWERDKQGRDGPNVAQIVSLCEVLGVTPNDLICPDGKFVRTKSRKLA